MNDTFRSHSPRLVRGLQYFETVARHRSVKAASEELGVSQSAVSHQLRDLTEALGERLLKRVGRGIELTPVGVRLAERLGTVFAGLQSSIEDVIGGGNTVLRLAVCSCFGPGWLIPRLRSFRAAHPQVDLQLRLYAQDPELTDQVADAFVTARPVVPGFASVDIFNEYLVSVIAPKRYDRADCDRVPLVTTELNSGRVGQDWLDYCSAAGLQLADIQAGSWMQSTHYLLALEMAKAGLGAALVPDFLAAREIESGTLAYFNRATLSSNRRYSLCFKETRAREGELKALVDWIKMERVPRQPFRLVR